MNSQVLEDIQNIFRRSLEIDPKSITADTKLVDLTYEYWFVLWYIEHVYRITFSYDVSTIGELVAQIENNIIDRVRNVC